MAAIELRLGATVFSGDNCIIGTVDRVIFNPRKQEIESVVVRRGLLLGKDVTVPVGLLGPEGDDLRLSLTKDDAEHLPEFEESRYEAPPEGWIAPEAIGYFGGPAGVLWPQPMSDFVQLPETDEALAGIDRRARTREEVGGVISRGNAVMSSDGQKLGEVVELAADPQSGRVSEVVVSRGPLAPQQVSVPAGWVESCLDGVVTLRVDAATFEGAARR